MAAGLAAPGFLIVTTIMMYTIHVKWLSMNPGLTFVTMNLKPGMLFQMKGLTSNPFAIVMNPGILKTEIIPNIQNGENTRKANEIRMEKRMRKEEIKTVNNITFQ